MREDCLFFYILSMSKLCRGSLIASRGAEKYFRGRCQEIGVITDGKISLVMSDMVLCFSRTSQEKHEG